MKKILILFAVISVFASCNSDQKTGTTKDVVGVSDSNLYKNNTIADTGHFAPAATVTTKSTKRFEREKTPEGKVTSHTTSTTTTPATINADTKTVTPAPVIQSSGTPVAPVATSSAPVKKGWSSAAKDATIGGVGGAIGGAILSKKKGKGAIIGGAIGAAGGYLLGRSKDKKTQSPDTTQ